jgi:hypothetical protein
MSDLKSKDKTFVEGLREYLADRENGLFPVAVFGRQYVSPSNEDLCELVLVTNGPNRYRVKLPMPTMTVSARFLLADVNIHSAFERRFLPRNVPFKVVIADPPFGFGKHTSSNAVRL